MLEHKQADFAQPDPSLVADALKTGLASHFQSVHIDIAACPDLTALGVACSGMTGSTALFEFGGEPYAHNPRHRRLALLRHG